MMPSPGQQPKSLEIRIRQTLFGDGPATWRATVFCPGQDRSLDLTDCLRCREFVEMSLDPGEQSGVLKCHPTKAPIPRSSPALLIEGGFSGVPVVDEGGKPIGVVSLADIVRHHSQSKVASDEARSTVGDIMTDISITLGEGALVSQAAALMALERIHRVPVVDRTGQVVGVLSSLDVLYWLACETGYVAQVVRSFLDKG
jgi:hypothetical protein